MSKLWNLAGPIRPRAVLLVMAIAATLLWGIEPTASAAAAAGMTWYAGAHGDDNADGRSPATAWRTLARVAGQKLAPGDTVLFEGGQTFAGTIRLTSVDAGSAGNPVRLGSYGAGRATIASAGRPGIEVYNTAGVDISDLKIVGADPPVAAVAGINAYNDLAGNRKLVYLHIRRVEVSGFRAGIGIGGGAGASGFKDVSVVGADVHDNVDAGLVFYGPAFSATGPVYAHEQVLVSDVHAHHNLGDAGELLRNTGSGIILGSVRGGLVEKSRAHDNGAACRAPEGPVGIWSYDSDHVTIERNISDHNTSAGPADGDGFDLDQNMSNSVMQGNLSFANGGAGFLVYTAAQNSAHHDNVVRFNVSVGDGARLAWYGGITVQGRVAGTRIEQNTVVVRATGSSLPPALRLGPGLSGVSVRNNILLSDGAGPVVVGTPASAVSVVLQGNSYSSFGRPWAVQWGTTTYGSLTAWRAATGQELVQGRSTGSVADPQLRDRSIHLVATAKSRIPTDVSGLTSLLLAATSPVGALGTALSAAPRRDGAPAGVFDVSGTPVDLSRPVAFGAYQPAR